MSETTADQQYHVVINHEEQYSIWPVDQDLPDGWRTEGTSGPEPECLAHIDEVWTDMRPLSLRRFMEEHADDLPEPDDLFDDDEPSLVDRLCEGVHPVRASGYPEDDPEVFRAAVDDGYVFVRFTGTRGGTELGIRLEPDTARGADFAGGTGAVTLRGTLTLDFEAVRCVAQLDPVTLDGTGRLERVGD